MNIVLTSNLSKYYKLNYFLDILIFYIKTIHKFECVCHIFNYQFNFYVLHTNMFLIFM